MSSLAVSIGERGASLSSSATASVLGLGLLERSLANVLASAIGSGRMLLARFLNCAVLDRCVDVAFAGAARGSIGAKSEVATRSASELKAIHNRAHYDYVRLSYWTDWILHRRPPEHRILPRLGAGAAFVVVMILAMELGWSIWATLRPLVVSLVSWAV
jgi:hypothetical protein